MKQIFKPLLLSTLGLSAMGAAECSPKLRELLTVSFVGYEWEQAGQNLANHRNQLFEKKLTPRNVGKLQVVARRDLGDNLEYTPALDASRIYITTDTPAVSPADQNDAIGRILALDRKTLATVWERNTVDVLKATPGIPEAALPRRVYFRNTPALSGNSVIVGTSPADLVDLSLGRATGLYVASLDKNTGATNWSQFADQRLGTGMTGSPSIFGQLILAPVSNAGSFWPEALARRTHGALLGLDLATGARRFVFDTIPDCTAPDAKDCISGAAVWQGRGAPAVDAKTGIAYIGAGQNYYVSRELEACFTAHPNDFKSCQPKENRFNSLIAIDTKSGAVVWSTPVDSRDIFTQACIFTDPARKTGLEALGVVCQDPALWRDWDFSIAPILFLAKNRQGVEAKLVGARQKNGIFFAFDAATGEIVWTKNLVTIPAAIDAGGAAYDGERLFVPHPGNAGLLSNINQGGTGTGLNNGIASYGVLSALDPNTGDIIWRFPTAAADNLDPTVGSFFGAPTVANGVVYVGSTNGHLYGLNAATGALLLDRTLGLAPLVAGPAVVGGDLVIGDGWRFGNTDFGQIRGGTLYRLALSRNERDRNDRDRNDRDRNERDGDDNDE